MTRRNTILAIALFVVATVAAYVPSFDGGYNFDDKPLLESNPHVKELKNIPLFFVSKEARVPWTHGGLQNDIYRPIQSASFAISYTLWGDNPGAFHKENVFLHLINGVLLYFLLFLLLNSARMGFVAALLFLVHPVQVEAVAYLVERASVLSLTFFLAAFGAFVQSERRPQRFNRYMWLSLGFFALALFTKEIAIILPVILVLYLACFREGEARQAKAIAARVWPFFAVALLYFVVRTINLGQVAQYETISIWRRLLVMSEVFWDYLKLIVFPARLTFFPSINTAPFELQIAYVFFVAVVAAFVAACILLYRRDRRAAFFPMAYAVALLPVSNIIPIKTYLQERFLYYPGVFIFAFAAILIVRAAHRLSDRRRVMGGYAVMVGAAVILLTARSHLRNRDWKDQETLMLKEASVNPDNGRVYFDLAVTRFREADYESSREYAEQALRNTRANVFLVEIYDLLGNLDKVAGEYERALENYRAAIRSDPSYPYPYNSIGIIYVKQGNVTGAIPFFEKAVERNPSDYIFNQNLGSAHDRVGNRQGAVYYWEKSLEINPDQPRLRRELAAAQADR